MRSAAITGAGRVEVLDQPRPTASRDLVVVKILIAPMCTEFKQRRDGVTSDSIGHEATGVVVDAGTSTKVAVGDRVVVMPHYGCGSCTHCTSGDHMHCEHQRDVLAESGQPYGTASYAQYVLKPDWLLAPIPDDIPLRRAALACCGLGPSFSALQRMHVGALDTLLVSGCGPVGLGAVVQGVLRGARVLAIETSPYRTELAYKLGAERVLDPRTEDVPALVHELTRGEGADAGVETSGAPTAARTLALSARRRSSVSFISWNDIELPALVPLGLTLHGIWHWNHLTSAPKMWDTVRGAGDQLDAMVTHTMALEDVSAAMDIQDRGECGKIFLLPFGEVEA
jgi:threonine dehydrogenase-like Zn-dependent dehydrogenase